MMAKEAAQDDSGLQSGHSLFQVLGVMIPFLSRRNPAPGLLRAKVAAEAGEVNTPPPWSPCLGVWHPATRWSHRTVLEFSPMGGSPW